MKNIRFEWDENKNKINKKKHGLSFEEAVEVFGDENAILFDDPDHSLYEDRFLIIGAIKSTKICIVSHCYCIFRKNRALAPHERSAVPLGTDHCPVG